MRGGVLHSLHPSSSHHFHFGRTHGLGPLSDQRYASGQMPSLSSSNVCKGPSVLGAVVFT